MSDLKYKNMNHPGTGIRFAIVAFAIVWEKYTSLLAFPGRAAGIRLLAAAGPVNWPTFRDFRGRKMLFELRWE